VARLYVVLSPLAKVAAAIAAVGIALVAYHRLGHASWAELPGSVLFFGGVLVYFVERIRLVLRRRREEQRDAT
jgi:hypothetical protein